MIWRPSGSAPGDDAGADAKEEQKDFDRAVKKLMEDLKPSLASARLSGRTSTSNLENERRRVRSSRSTSASAWRTSTSNSKARRREKGQGCSRCLNVGRSQRQGHLISWSYQWSERPERKLLLAGVRCQRSQAQHPGDA